PAARKLGRASPERHLAPEPRGRQEPRMSSAPPTIFSPARRQAVRERIAGLQRRPDAARFVIDDMLEDVLERLAFLRHEPKRSLVIGDWTGELVGTLRRGGSEVAEARPETLDEERPYPFGGFDL